VPRIKKASTADAPDTQSIIQWVAELATAKAQQKFFKGRQDQVTKRLKEYVEEHGYQDDQGHIWFDLDEAVEGVVALQMQRRVSQPLKEEKAEEILSAKGLLERCTKTITVLDEDAIMAAKFTGELTDDDIDAMFPKQVSYALMTPSSK
jgi:hypothetical protein